MPVDHLQVIRHTRVGPDLERFAAVAIQVKPVTADERKREVLGGDRVAGANLAAVGEVGGENARRPDAAQTRPCTTSRAWAWSRTPGSGRDRLRSRLRPLRSAAPGR